MTDVGIEVASDRPIGAKLQRLIRPLWEVDVPPSFTADRDPEGRQANAVMTFRRSLYAPFPGPAASPSEADRRLLRIRLLAAIAEQVSPLLEQLLAIHPAEAKASVDD